MRRNNALAAVFAPAGNPGGLPVGSIQCLINVDASTANNDPACVPLNLFGIGVADPAAIDYILGDPYRDQVLEQTVFGANFSFTPFATWAGDVSVAVGAEYRKEKIDGLRARRVPADLQPGDGRDRRASGRSATIRPSKGSYNVKEAYLETVVPLGFGLEFNGAVRGDRLFDLGLSSRPGSAGATWQPIDDIRFRVNRSRDIRAPNLNELYQAGTANSRFGDATPSFPGPGRAPAPMARASPISGTITGNLNLRPEKADSWNIGGVLSPRFLPGFSALGRLFPRSR